MVPDVCLGLLTTLARCVSCVQLTVPLLLLLLRQSLSVPVMLHQIPRHTVQRVARVVAQRGAVAIGARAVVAAPLIAVTAAARPSVSATSGRRAFSAAAAAAAPASGSLTSKKVFASAAEALKASGAKDGDTFVVGGFGLSVAHHTSHRGDASLLPAQSEHMAGATQSERCTASSTAEPHTTNKR